MTRLAAALLGAATSVAALGAAALPGSATADASQECMAGGRVWVSVETLGAFCGPAGVSSTDLLRAGGFEVTTLPDGRVCRIGTYPSSSLCHHDGVDPATKAFPVPWTLNEWHAACTPAACEPPALVSGAVAVPSTFVHWKVGPADVPPRLLRPDPAPETVAATPAPTPTPIPHRGAVERPTPRTPAVVTPAPRPTPSPVSPDGPVAEPPAPPAVDPTPAPIPTPPSTPTPSPAATTPGAVPSSMPSATPTPTPGTSPVPTALPTPTAPPAVTTSAPTSSPLGVILVVATMSLLTLGGVAWWVLHSAAPR